MNLAFFIARRIGGAPAGARSSAMVRVAQTAVALSIAVMIVSLAVVTGFKEEIVGKLTGISSHGVVTDVRSLGSLDGQPLRRTDSLERLLLSTPGVAGIAPYALRGGIVRTDEGMQGVVLKGVDASYDWASAARTIVAGALPRVGEPVRTKDILIGRPVARMLGLSPGDKVEMLFVDREAAPRRDRFKISGIYSTGMEETDAQTVLTDLRNVQRLWDWTPDLVTGYEVRTDDFSTAAATFAVLNDSLLFAAPEGAENVVACSLEGLYPQLFDWLRTHDVNAVIVIAIMLFVALFNMATVLLIGVLERTRMIGLLKTMGMPDGQLQSLFLWRGAFIVLRGAFWGNLVGVGLCLLQRTFHLVRLDTAGYLLSEVPIRLEWGWWLALNAGAVAVIVALLAVPTYIVSTVKPEESIRYQ